MPVGRPAKDKRPQHCKEEHIRCEECVGACARNMAALSGELVRPMLRSLFHIMYAEPACRPMEATFVQTYQMAAAPEPALLYHSAAA